MTKLTPEEEAQIIRKVASKHPILQTVIAMADNTMPYGLEGMLDMQKDIDDLKTFEGTDDEFTQLLRNKRDAFRKKHNLTDDNDMTEEEELKYKAVANLVKDLTTEKPMKK